MAGEPANVRNLIRRSLYQLKHRYGFPIDLYQTTKESMNTQTGQYNFTTKKAYIRRAIIMPSTVQRSFFFSISVIQANSKFIQGGDIQLNDRQVIIDASDLPRDWKINIDDYFIWENQRYDIKVAEGLDNQTGYVLNGRKVQGIQNKAIHDLRLSDYVKPFDSFGVVL